MEGYGFDIINEVSVEAVVASAAKDRVLKLASHILGSEVDDIEKATEVLNIELRIFPTNFSVSRGEKRPPQQYFTNDYHLSLSFNAWYAFLFILKKSLSDSDPVAKYTQLVNTYYALVTKKITSHENMLRDLIADMKRRDGVV